MTTDASAAVSRIARGSFARPTEAKYAVLAVEDEKDTTSAVVAELRAAGAYVQEEADLLKAESVVTHDSFDLLLVDLRLPRGDLFLQNGGVDFVLALNEGSFGPRNQRTPFVILTAFIHEVDRVPLLKLEGFLNVLPKTAPVLLDLATSLGSRDSRFLSLLGAVSLEHVLDDLLVFESGPDGKGVVRATVGSWAHGETVGISVEDLPDELQQELAYGVFPVFAWAKVHPDAVEEENVRPHDFRLEIAEDEGDDPFDWVQRR